MSSVPKRNLHHLESLVRRLGGSIEPRRGTGELVWRHPLLPRPCITQAFSRRKDPTRALLHFVRCIERLIANHHRM